MEKKFIPIFIIIMLTIPIFSINAISNDNETPTKPIITGPCETKLHKTCNYTIWSTDPQGDNIFYEIKYIDDPMAIIEMGPYDSGISVTFEHCWCTYYHNCNPFCIKVRARDIDGHISDWSIFETNITDLDKVKTITNTFIIPLFLQIIFQLFPIINKILNQIIL